MHALGCIASILFRFTCTISAKLHLLYLSKSLLKICTVDNNANTNKAIPCLVMFIILINS